MDAANINTPPAQDSPKNLVNILNDMCLQLVLLNLKNVDDFWSAAQVCTRFKANAIACFPFKQVKFFYNRTRINVNRILFDSANDFLSVFGPQIKTIHCNFVANSKDVGQVDHEKNFRLISQYCGQTLNELEVNGTFSDSIIIRQIPPFQALNRLKMLGVSFYRFDPSLIFPQLKSIHLSCIDRPMDWIASRFPMLKSLQMFTVYGLTDEIFIEFQKYNRQLQRLECLYSKDYTTAVWKRIGDRLPNIVELRLTDVGANIFHLSALQHLRILRLSEFGYITQRKRHALFFRSLLEQNQPIEELDVLDVDMELGKILQGFKSIKVLNVTHTSEEIALDLITHLPELRLLHVDVYYDEISLLTVRKIVESCKKVKEINICGVLAVDETIDFNKYVDEYESIVALVTGRVKVNFTYRSDTETDSVIRRCLEDLLSSYNNYWIRFSKH